MKSSAQERKEALRTLRYSIDLMRPESRRIAVAIDRLNKRFGTEERGSLRCASTESLSPCVICDNIDAREEIRSHICHFEASLNGDVAAFGADPSLATDVASQQVSNVKGRAAELEAILYLSNHCGYEWNGWKHSIDVQRQGCPRADHQNAIVVMGARTFEKDGKCSAMQTQEVDLISTRWQAHGQQNVSVFCEVKDFNVSKVFAVGCEYTTEFERLLAQLQRYRVAADQWHAASLRRRYVLRCWRAVDLDFLSHRRRRIKTFLLCARDRLSSAPVTHHSLRRYVCSWIDHDDPWGALPPNFSGACRSRWKYFYERIRKETAFALRSASTTAIPTTRWELDEIGTEAMSTFRPLVVAILQHPTPVDVARELSKHHFGTVVLSTHGADDRDLRSNFSLLREWRHCEQYDVERTPFRATTRMIDRINLDVSAICLLVSDYVELRGFARTHPYLIKSSPTWMLPVDQSKALGYYDEKRKRGSVVDGQSISDIVSACSAFRSFLCCPGRTLIACRSIVDAFEDYLRTHGNRSEHRRWYERVKHKLVHVVPDAELDFPFAEAVMSRGKGIGQARHLKMLSTGFLHDALTATSQVWAMVRLVRSFVIVVRENRTH